VLISREAIAAMIPHAGSMCLLDGVLAWDAGSIRCLSRTHRDRHNPLRVDERLPALCGVEYAAQAMAIHGVLAGNVGKRPRLGYLASLREVHCSRSRLDDLEGDLIVEAERLMGEESRVIYSFDVRVGAVCNRRGCVLASEGVDLARWRPALDPIRRQSSLRRCWRSYRCRSICRQSAIPRWRPAS